MLQNAGMIGVMKAVTWIVSLIALITTALDPTITVAIIAAVPPTILSFVTLYVSVKSKAKIEEIHTEVKNGTREK